MVSLSLHRDATQNMKEYFFGYLFKVQYGKFDLQSTFANRLKDHNIKLIQQNKSGLDVDTELEWQKMLMINIANDYITNVPDKARKITIATTLRAAIITELDSGVDSFYSPSYHFDTTFTTQ